jgi:type II secretory pathway component GspD/PulD (secretin)
VLKLSVEQGVTLPVVSRRFTDHVVRVKDGATIVIGGLIRNDEIEQMSKVPLLGDLPFLGRLFRHTSKSSDHTEVVMFITASIVKD